MIKEVFEDKGDIPKFICICQLMPVSKKVGKIVLLQTIRQKEQDRKGKIEKEAATTSLTQGGRLLAVTAKVKGCNSEKRKGFDA